MLNANIFYLISGLLYLIFLILCIKRRVFSLQRHIIIFLLFLYFNAVIAITLFPIPFDSRFIAFNVEHGIGRKFNFVPFMFIKDLISNISRDRIPVFGNMVLLFPLGYLVPIIFKKINNLIKAALVGLVIAISIETLQFIISYFLGFRYRSVDVDDLILNTTGTVIGYLMLILTIPMFENFSRITLEIKPLVKDRIVTK